jgi:predicted RNase H-like nuclease (RuvC/YqgF family)
MAVLHEVQEMRALENVSDFRWTDLEAKLKSLEVEFQVLYSERKAMKETIDLQHQYKNVVNSTKASLSCNDDHWKDAQMRAQKQMTDHLTCELTQEKIRVQELEAMLFHGDSPGSQNQVSTLETAVAVAEERASNAEARAGAAESDYELVAQELANTRKTVAKLEGELERAKEYFAQEMSEMFRRQPSGSPNGSVPNEAPSDKPSDKAETISPKSTNSTKSPKTPKSPKS